MIWVKTGPVGPILNEKLVQLDHFWQLKLAQPDQKCSSVTNSARMSPVLSKILIHNLFVSHTLPLAHIAICVAVNWH